MASVEADAGVSASEHREPLGVIVLGSGRSGTSAIMRALAAAGFFVGREADLFGAAPSNSRGHFEALSVLAIDEELLKRFGCHWWADAPGEQDLLGVREEFTPRIETCLEDLVSRAEGHPVAVKEPRINALMTLWGPALQGALHPVLAVRNPLEIAFSHQSRDGTSTAHALASWEHTTIAVLKWAEGRTVTIAPFPKILADPTLTEGVIEAAASHLPAELRAAVTTTAAPSALEPALQHEKAAGHDLGEYLTKRQLDLWDYLGGLPAGDVTVTIPESLRGSGEAARGLMSAESERMRVLDVYADAVRQVAASEGQTREAHEEMAAAAERAAARETELARRVATLEAAAVAASAREAAAQGELEAMRGSSSWRLTAPLRAASQALRRRRN